MLTTTIHYYCFPTPFELIQRPSLSYSFFLYVDVGTIIEVQQHIIAAKPVETTDKQAPVTATECAASTSQVKPAATEVGSPAPQVVELLTSESETSSPQKRVHTGPPAEESASSSSPSKTSVQKSSGNLSDFSETGKLMLLHTM